MNKIALVTGITGQKYLVYQLLFAKRWFLPRRVPIEQGY